MNQKKYKIQGYEYEFKKPCITLTELLDKLNDDYIGFENEIKGFPALKREYEELQQKLLQLEPKTFKQIQKEPAKILEFIKDEGLKEKIIEISTKYTLESLRIKKKFLKKKENIKNILETCLAGDTSKINYEVEGKEYFELKNTVEEVFNDFFLNMKD